MAWKILAIGGAFVLPLAFHFAVTASDHDDGETELKGRSLNLTDLYVFREDWQDSGGSSEHMIFVMNTTPRAIARQQYTFSTRARYQFHVARVGATQKSTRPDGQEDIVMRLEFAEPDDQGRQGMRLTVNRNGQVAQAPAGFTTSLLEGGSPRINTVSIAGFEMQLFAGLREDPFYFDVERFFRVRALLATGINTLSGPTQGGPNPFRSTATAVDFAAGYNVNSIVLRVPITFLQTTNREPIFDVWETIWVRN